jgi:prepilin-type N-terminal cleavage/methylation domain-containing protein
MQGRDKEEVTPRRGRHDAAGFTFVEVMIVIAIVSMVAAGVILGVSSISRSRLRSSAFMLAASVQRAFSYATTRNESVRLVLDIDEREILFESTEGNVLIDKENLEGKTEEEEGAEAEEKKTEAGAEKTLGGGAGLQGGGTDTTQFSLGVDQLAERIKNGFHTGEVPRYKPPTFTPVADSQLAERQLDDGVAFYAVYSQLFDGEKKEGKAYVFFFPDGTADHTVVQLQGKSGEIYTVEILPWSARVKIYDYLYEPDFEDETLEEE